MTWGQIQNATVTQTSNEEQGRTIPAGKLCGFLVSNHFPPLERGNE